MWWQDNSTNELIKKRVEERVLAEKEAIENLVGKEAAAFGEKAMTWIRIELLGVVAAILGIWLEAGSRSAYYWGLVGAGVAAVLIGGIPGHIFQNRSADAASQVISAKVGRPVRIACGGHSLGLWRHEIDSAMQRL